MKTNALTAEKRTEKGKNACNRVRSRGYIPAVVYSHGESESIQVPRKEFSNLFHGHVSESVLIGLNYADGSGPKDQKVIVKDYQLDPVTDDVIHLDFYKVTTGEKLQTMVPVIITGTSKGERMGGILETLERELMIECLPSDLPEKFEIDVTDLEIGRSIHVKDLSVTGSVKFLVDAERVIVAVLAPKAVKEEVVVEEAAAEAAAAEAEAPDEEGKQKTEGKQKPEGRQKPEGKQKSEGKQKPE